MTSDLLGKFNDVLRGLDSVIESHDYSPTIGCALHNHRIALVDLGKQIERAESTREE